MKRIIYINTFAWGSGHEMFDASLLLMCTELAEYVELRITKNHFKIISKLLENQIPNNIVLKPVKTIGGEGKFQLLFRYILGWFLDFFYLFFTKTNDIVLFPYNNVMSLHSINFLNKILKRKIIICCHGEMEAILSNVNRKGILSKLLYNICVNFFSKAVIAPNLYFMVLGDCIKDNLRTRLNPRVYDHFISIDHPYIFRLSKLYKSRNFCRLRIGTIGYMSIAKGQHQFIEFVKICKQKNIDVDVVHIGRIDYVDDEMKSLDCFTQQSGKFLTREEFSENVNQLDYILYFYPRENYKVTASGAILDAIAYEKPIIAIKNEYFQYFFEKFGDFGYLLETLSQMVDVVEKIAKVEFRRKYNFNSIKDKLKPEMISHSLVKELKRIHFIE